MVDERDEAPPPVERFQTLGGRFVGVIGLVMVAAFLLAGILDPDVAYPLWMYPAAGFAVVLIWASLMRPTVRIEGDRLVLRNMLDTVRIPLAGVEEVSVRQFLAVRVGGKRYVGAGVSRTALQSMRDDRRAGGESPQRSYGGWVENRLWDLVYGARRDQGIEPFSEEQAALGSDVRREWAWPEIALLVAFGLAAVVGALL